MNRYSGRLYVVMTMLVAVFAASVAQAAVAKPKNFSMAGGSRTLTYTLTSQNLTEVVTVTATSSAPEWLHVGTVTPETVTLVKGKGKVQVTYQVDPKTDATSRSATISINGTVAETVNQAGAPCKLRLDANQTTFQYFGGSSPITFQVPEGCVVEARTAANNGNGKGNGKTADWYDVAKDELTGAYVVTVQPLAGNGRTGKVYFSASDPVTRKADKKVFTIIQKKRMTGATVAMGDPTPITTGDEAAKAASSLVFVAKTTFDASEGIGGIGGDAVKRAIDKLSPVSILGGVMQKSGAVKTLAGAASATPKDCTDGGTVTISGSKWVFAACKEDNEEINGLMTLSGTPDLVAGTLSGSIKLGAAADTPFTIKSYEDSNYNQLTETSSLYLKLDVANLAVAPTENGFDVTSFDVRASGQADNVFTEEGKEMKMLLDVKDFQVMYTKTDTGSNTTATGMARTTVLADDVVVASRELAVQDVAVTVAPAESGATVTASGKFAIKSYPENSCFDGTYTIGTPTSFTFSEEAGVAGGTITLNDQAITIGTDGTGTITLGGNPVSVPSVNTSCVLN